MKNLFKKAFAVLMALSFYSLAVAEGQKDILSILPENTQVVYSVKSIETTIKSLGLQEKTFFGEPTEKFRKKLANKIGFDLLKIEELKKHGIDPSGNAGFALSEFKLKENVNEEPDYVFSVFLPINDEAKAISSLKKVLTENQKAKVTFGKEDNLNFAQKGYQKFYYFIKKGYLFLSFGKSANILNFISGLEAENKLKGNEFYQELAKKIKSEEDIIFYVNSKSIFAQPFEKLGENAPDSDKKKILSAFAMLKDYRGILVLVDMNKKDLVVSAAVALEKGSEILDISKPKDVNRNLIVSISDTLGLLLSLSFDPMKYYQFITKFLSASELQSLEQGFEVFKTQYGVDLKKDLLENMDGNFNLGTFDAKTISMFNYNTVFTIGLKDPAITKAAFNKIYETVPAEQKGMITKNGDDYLINAMVVQVSISFKQNTLVIGSSKAIADKATGQGKGLLSKIKDPKVKDVIGGKTPWIMYISADEVNKVVKNLVAMSSGQNKQKSGKEKKKEKEVMDLIAQFEYLFVYSDLQDNISTGEFVIKTKFKGPFFKSLSNLIGKLK